MSILKCGSDVEKYWLFNWNCKSATDSLNIKIKPDVNFQISDNVAWVDSYSIDSAGNFKAQIGIQADEEYIEEFKKKASIRFTIWISIDTLIDTTLLFREIIFDSNNLSKKDFYIK